MSPGMGSVVGALGGAAVSAFGAHKANKKNIALSKDQMAFQERMSNTAHQREVKDLKAAGLNPALSAMGGQGAASPSGQTAQMKNIAEGASNSAMAFMQGLKSIEKTDAEIQNIKADTSNKTPEAKVKDIISEGIDSTKTAFSAKSVKAKKQSLKWGYKNYVQPEVNSAKKKYKSYKKQIINKFQSYKNKFNKMFN